MRHTQGFDHKWYNQELLISLRFCEGTGTTTRDWAKAHHPITFGGTPTWQNLANDLTVLEFSGPGSGDEVVCAGATSADLDFTNENFSLTCWCYSTSYSNASVIMNRGVLDTCGWEWYGAANTNLAIRTNQAGDREGATAVGYLKTGVWQFLGFIRYGLHGQMYIDGRPVDTLQTAAGLLDPVACGAQQFLVGNNPHDNGFTGQLWNPRVWARQLGENEMLAMFEDERGLFGV